MTTENILPISNVLLSFLALFQLVYYQFIFLPRFNKKIKKMESELKQSDLINQERWKLKRDACFNALNIADNIISSYSYINVPEGSIKPGKVTTEEVRKCFNDLACSCDDSEVIEILKKILFTQISPDIIVDLRNAVRKELNFDTEDFDKDRENAFIGRIISDPDLKKTS